MLITNLFYVKFNAIAYVLTEKYNFFIRSFRFLHKICNINFTMSENLYFICYIFFYYILFSSYLRILHINQICKSAVLLCLKR